MIVPSSIASVTLSALSLPTNTGPSSAHTLSLVSVITPCSSASSAVKRPERTRTSTVWPNASETSPLRKELTSPGAVSVEPVSPPVLPPSVSLPLLFVVLVTLLSISPSLILMSPPQPVSTARFANVAFSDGSLLYGFTQRLRNKQPISAPVDIQRYFVTQREAGELCLMSCLLGRSRDIFFPKESDQMRLTYLHEVALSFLETHGYEPVLCENEQEARARVNDLIARRKWPNCRI